MDPCYFPDASTDEAEFEASETLSNETVEARFTEKAETWALGCCLYYLVTKIDPFEGATVKETKQNIIRLKLNPSNEPIDPIIV